MQLPERRQENHTVVFYQIQAACEVRAKHLSAATRFACKSETRKSIYLTSRVPRFDLGLQFQRDVRHLFVGRVASASPFRFFGGVTLEVNKCHQTVAAGLTASCG